MTNPRPPDQPSQESSIKDARKILHKHPMLATRVLEEIRLLGLERPRVLEAGCESGWFAQHFSDVGSYTGLDSREASFHEAGQCFGRADFVVADVLGWDDGGRQFDLVLSIEQLAMCTDHASVLSRLSALVRPGGYVVVSTENPFVYNRMSWMNGPLSPGEVRNRISGRDLRRSLEATGLSVVREFTFLPMGTDGILWWVNAEGINGIIQKFIPAPTWQRMKEAVGLGQFRVVIARRAPGAVS